MDRGIASLIDCPEPLMAFETIHHSILLDCLSGLGRRPFAVVPVLLGREVSGSGAGGLLLTPLAIEVLQGSSVLSLTLFNTYTMLLAVDF